MVYKHINKLTIMRLNEKRKVLYFDECLRIMQQFPSNIIYVIIDDIFYGIVTAGDINRAVMNTEKQEVLINRKFLFVSQNQYKKALELFYENKNIQEIPVINEMGRLEGAYNRWNDLKVLESEINYFDNETGIKAGMIVLIRPSDYIEYKIKVFQKFYDFLIEKQLTVEIIDSNDIEKYIGKADIFLFVDEDEKSGCMTCATINGMDFYLNKIQTFWEFIKQFKNKYDENKLEYERNFGSNVLKKLQEKGVKILTVETRGTRRIFYEKLKNEIKKNKRRWNEYLLNKKEPEWSKSFFGELYSSSYVREVMLFSWEHKYKDGMLCYADVQSNYFNVRDEKRKTVGTPINSIQRIFCFGPCVMFGNFVEDKFTIESLIQKKLNCLNYEIEVINKGGIFSMFDEYKQLFETDFKEHDILIFYHVDDSSQGISVEDIENINLTDIWENNNVSADWFIDSIYHFNHKCNELIAEEIWKKIQKKLLKNKVCEKPVKHDKLSVEKLKAEVYLGKYFSKYLPKNKVGSIVMNCNPFTKGHRYLIDKALEIVDYLIIFVVEEDRSIFSFEERFEMVRRGVSDINNVIVVPSGEIILSYRTFPEYFGKVIDEHIEQYMEYDINFFADYICPPLNIRYRFVGEEMEDIVTRAYNQTMKKILPVKGIELIEIPRIQVYGQNIRATMVRSLLNDKNIKCKEFDDFLPESSKEIIFYECR